MLGRSGCSGVLQRTHAALWARVPCGWASQPGGGGTQGHGQATGRPQRGPLSGRKRSRRVHGGRARGPAQEEEERGAGQGSVEKEPAELRRTEPEGDQEEQAPCVRGRVGKEERHGGPGGGQGRRKGAGGEGGVMRTGEDGSPPAEPRPTCSSGFWKGITSTTSPALSCSSSVSVAA